MKARPKSGKVGFCVGFKCTNSRASYGKPGHSATGLAQPGIAVEEPVREAVGLLGLKARFRLIKLNYLHARTT